MKKICLAITLSLIVCSTYGIAQDFNLFKETEQSALQNNSIGLNSPTVEQNLPSFTLRATSRFGDNYWTTLVGDNGENIRVPWSEGMTSEIEGYAGYSVVFMNSREVSIKLPLGINCNESSTQFINCSQGGDLLTLQLSNVIPIDDLQARAQTSIQNSQDNSNLSLLIPPQLANEIELDPMDGAFAEEVFISGGLPITHEIDLTAWNDGLVLLPGPPPETLSSFQASLSGTPPNISVQQIGP